MTSNPTPHIPDMFPETIAAPKFKRGDVVYLNSHPGVRMTVMGCIRNNGTAKCFWFFPNLEIGEAEFPEDCLSLGYRQDPTTLTPVPCTP